VKRLLSLLLVALTLWSLAFPALAMNLEIPKHPSTARMRVGPKLGEGVDLNLYRYCGNSPTGNSDPSGLVPQCEADCVATKNMSSEARRGYMQATMVALKETPWLLAGNALGYAVRAAAAARAANLARYGPALNLGGATAAGEAMIPAMEGGTLNIVAHGFQLTPAVLEGLSAYVTMMKGKHSITAVRLIACGAGSTTFPTELAAATSLPVWASTATVWTGPFGLYVSPFAWVLMR
jgi:hypothetical protein